MSTGPPEAHTALFAFAADRGHFVWSLPLAEALVTLPRHALKSNPQDTPTTDTRQTPVVSGVEYWTSEQSVDWVAAGINASLPVSVGGSLGRFAKEVVDVYTYVSSSGETDEDGGTALETRFEAELNDANLSLEMLGPPEPVKTRLSERLAKGDVTVVVCEQVWCGWVQELAAAASIPCVSFQPSYIDVFRKHANVPHRSFQEGYDFGAPGMVYTLASCLRRDSPVPLERQSVGAMLPLQWTASIQNSLSSDIATSTTTTTTATTATRPDCGRESAALYEWLEDSDVDSTPPLPVVYCSLGSHMLSRALDAGSLGELIRGVVDADCRVLMVVSDSVLTTAMAGDPTLASMVSAVRGDGGGGDDVTLMGSKRGARSVLRFESWVDQPSILRHESVRVFVSHCGANSIHEALACALPIVAMPFFDDQHYNANALVRTGAAVRVSKRPVKSTQVTEAVKAILAPEAANAARELQRDVLEENGTLAACRIVYEALDSRNK
eukprot:GFYU01013184.1.p1 GENE.GFYU01013184.1~~GFYU01013184.1.p1  ORF type:complete len:496 (+),score=72.39 GFYU01013184.1:161-1648(+)